MIDFKITAIVAIIVALFSGGLTYKYQQNHYENIISRQQSEQLTEVTNLTTKVLDTERKNNEITDALNKKHGVQTAKISALRSQLDSYKHSNGSVSVTARCSEATTGTADTTSLRAPATTTNDSAGVCQLPEMFTTTIIETAVAADILRNTALVCKEYSEAIEKQRKELSNDNKQ